MAGVGGSPVKGFEMWKRHLAAFPKTKSGWEAASTLHADWWEAAHCAAEGDRCQHSRRKAEFEYLYDKPLRRPQRSASCAWPVPSPWRACSPHRVLGVDADDELDPARRPGAEYHANSRPSPATLPKSSWENLAKPPVCSRPTKPTSINLAIPSTPWPATFVCGEGRYSEGANGEGQGGNSKRAAIFIGPEFGTVQPCRPRKPPPAKAETRASMCSSPAPSTTRRTPSEFSKLGRIPVLKARMNADLHMARGPEKHRQRQPLRHLRRAGHRTPPRPGRPTNARHKSDGVDVLQTPRPARWTSCNADGIACWILDTDYNEESFFVRHAYFLGSGDPYKSLKNTLKAEIDMDAWATLNSDISRPFDKPKSGRIAVKVINHLGDEVMKVFRVG